MPDWLYSFKELILVNLLPLKIISTYQIYHDIGKPYCKTYELNDKQKYHFPNHANISANLYASIDNNPIIENLIKRDMDIHTIKAEQINSFIGKSQLDKMTAITLIISGLSEIHANAAMFGGINSTSFKIKYKQINTKAKQILKLISGETK